MAVYLKTKPTLLIISPVRITVAIILLIICTVQLTLLFSEHVAVPTPNYPYASLMLNRTQFQTNSESLLNLLHQRLFETSNSTRNCEHFKLCTATRKESLVQSCLQMGGRRLTRQFSGSHSTQYYYNHDVESCSGNEEKLLDSPSFDVSTAKVQTSGSTNTRILQSDSPLLRVYQYYESLRSGVGYLYLGETIVYRYRHFNLSRAWKLPYIYQARLSLLWDSVDKKNPYENPLGPTFLEFMAYLVDVNTIKPKHLAPTILNCRACDIDYDVIVRNQNELRCVDTTFATRELAQDLSHDTKREIYRSYQNLPQWILAQVYDIYANDLNTFQC